MSELRFDRTVPISPRLAGDDWSGTRDVPLYWRARARLQLPLAPRRDMLKVLADGHYL